MIKNIKQSSKQIRPVTFFHQRMLRNKKSKKWMLEWLWIIKRLERKKMFDMRNNFMLELMQLHVWKRHIHFQYRYHYSSFTGAFCTYEICKKRIMYVHFIDQVPLFNILHMIFLLPLRKLHKMQKSSIYCLYRESGFEHKKVSYTYIQNSSWKESIKINQNI